MYDRILTFLSGLDPILAGILVISISGMYFLHMLAIHHAKKANKPRDFDIKVLDMVSSSLDDIQDLKAEVDRTRLRVVELELKVKIIQTSTFNLAGEVDSWLYAYPPKKDNIRHVRNKLLDISKGDLE